MLLTVEQVAYQLAVPAAYVRRLCAEGRLRTVTLYSTARKRPPLRIMPASLAEYLRRCGASLSDCPPDLPQPESQRRAELAKARREIRQQNARITDVRSKPVK